MKRFYSTVMIAVLCGVFMTACPSLWKHMQIITLSDKDGTVIGGIGGFKVHYVANADKDYPEDHYSIVITNANMGADPGTDSKIPAISEGDLAQVNAICVASTATNNCVTDADGTTGSYLCDSSIDPKNPGFGCRIRSSNLGDTKSVYIKLQLTDGTFWKSETLDLNDSTDYSELGTEVQDVIASIGSGKPLELTLKSCPADAYGNVIETTVDKDCPTKASPNTNCTAPETLDPTTNTCVQPSSSPPPPPPQPCTSGTGINLILLGGTCGSKCSDPATQVVRLGKCVCIIGDMPDPKDPTKCIADPSYNADLNTSPSTGGGGCSLIRE